MTFHPLIYGYNKGNDFAKQWPFVRVGCYI